MLKQFTQVNLKLFDKFVDDVNKFNKITVEIRTQDTFYLELFVINI